MYTFHKQTQNCNQIFLFYRKIFAIIRILCSTNQIIYGHTSSVKPFATEAEGFFSWNIIIIGSSLAINKHKMYPLLVWAHNHGQPMLTITHTKHWTKITLKSKMWNKPKNLYFNNIHMKYTYVRLHVQSLVFQN